MDRITRNRLDGLLRYNIVDASVARTALSLLADEIDELRAQRSQTSPEPDKSEPKADPMDAAEGGPGWYDKYAVERWDGKPIQGPVIVLELGKDPQAIELARALAGVFAATRPNFAADIEKFVEAYLEPKTARLGILSLGTSNMLTLLAGDWARVVSPGGPPRLSAGRTQLLAMDKSRLESPLGRSIQLHTAKLSDMMEVSVSGIPFAIECEHELVRQAVLNMGGKVVE